eukprot:gene35166-42596_t
MEPNRAFLSHIIYPESFVNDSKSSSWLIGWNIDEFKCIIACLIEKSQASLEDLEHALHSIQTDSRYGMYQYAHLSTYPIVLGEWIVDRSDDFFPDPSCQARGIWLVLSPNQNNLSNDPQCQALFQQPSSSTKSIFPKLHSLYSLGNKYVTSSYLLSYPPIHTHNLHCITLSDPAKIDLESTSLLSSHHQVNSSKDNALDRIGRVGLRFRGAESEKTGLDMLGKSGLAQGPKGDRCSELELIVGLINYSDDLLALILDYIHQPPTAQLVSNRFAKYVTLLVKYIGLTLAWLALYTSNVWYCFLYTINRAYSKTRPLLSYVNDQLVWRELKLSYDIASSSPSNPSTSPLANTTVSLDTLSLCCVCMVERFSMLTTLYKECILFFVAYNLHPAIRSKLFTSMCYKLLQMLGDVLLGVGLGYFVLHAYYSSIHQAMCTMPVYYTRLIMETLVWFTQSPGGIKLNPYITSAFSSLFVHAIQTYITFVSPWLEAHTPLLIHIFAYLGGFGLSIQLSLFIDIWYLCTLPYNLLYTFFTHYTHIHASILKSMYLMFTGSKVNILRHFRIDSNVYDNTQLWFGMWFFSIFFFLFPSFYVYYFYFAVLQCVSISVQYFIYMVFCIPAHVIPLYIPILYTCIQPLIYMATAVGVMCSAPKQAAISFATVDKTEIAYDRSIRKTAGGASTVPSSSSLYTSTSYSKPSAVLSNPLVFPNATSYTSAVANKKLSPQSPGSSEVSPRVGGKSKPKSTFTFADEDIQLLQSKDDGDGDAEGAMSFDAADYPTVHGEDDDEPNESGEVEVDEDRDASLSPISKPSSVD